jgi:hypothetical protein
LDNLSVTGLRSLPDSIAPAGEQLPYLIGRKVIIFGLVGSFIIPRP